MNRLKYHEAAVELLPVRPTISPERLRLLDDIEQNHNITLPAALREWYALDEAEKILQDHSNSDIPYRLEGLAKFANGGCLFFQGENQGCWQWAVPLNGLDDPPVYEDDSYVAIQCSDSFSNWVYCQIWDGERANYGLYHSIRVMSDRFPTVQVCIRNNCPSPLPIQVLETFTPDRVNHPCGETVRRYHRGRQYLWVLEGRFYYVTGETEVDLEKILRELIAAGVPLATLIKHDLRHPSPAQRVLDRICKA